MNFFQKPYVLLLLLGAAIIFGSGNYYAKVNNNNIPIKVTGAVEAEESQSATIKIHVSGQVVKPGLYEFTNGKRLDDAINEAVLLPDADLNGLNLAELLVDGQKIHVPSLVKSNDVTNITQTGNSGANLININLATQSELETLPGIGPALAQRIIEYREQKGSFKNTEEIKQVSGIGDKKYESIKNLISTY